MSHRDPGTDASFEGLRQAHRSEQAPAALRRRALERARAQSSRGERAELPARRWWSRGPWLALAAAVAAGGWFAVSRSALDGPASTSTVAGPAVTPTAEPSPRPASPVCPKPLPTPVWDPTGLDSTAEVTGLNVGVLETSTVCGPLARRYLLRAFEAVAPSSPVLIVLHDAWQSAEDAQIATRWWFDDLALRKFAVLVYANGGPGAPRAEAPKRHEGVWQTDAAAHPAVDDVAYLQAIVKDLQARLGLAQGEVFLAGYGSGAEMALSAALQHPDRFAGVAAFLPTRSPRQVELGPAPGAALAAAGQRQLRSLFLTLPKTSGESPSALALKWAATLGSEASQLRVTRQKPGISRIDTSLASGVRLRILTLPSQVNPFPGPGGADPLARAASASMALFFDGPGAAWDFFKSRE